jgi:hypothetical protein
MRPTDSAAGKSRLDPKKSITKKHQETRSAAGPLPP